MGTKTIEDSAMIKVKSSTFIAIQKWYKSMEYGLDKDHVSTTNITVINDSSMRRKWKWPVTNHKWIHKKGRQTTTNYSTGSNKESAKQAILVSWDSIYS